MQLISFRLPESLIKKIDKTAKKSKQNRSEFIRTILENAVGQPMEQKSVGLSEVRDELLLAVGQLGDSLRQLPKFMKAAEVQLADRVEPESAGKRGSKNPADGQSRSLNTKPLRPAQPSSTIATPKPKISGGQKSTDVGWSNQSNSKPEMTLRPRQEPVAYQGEVTGEAIKKTVRPKSSKGGLKVVASELIKSDSADGRPDRRRRSGELTGRPIGEERRQSIRLARVIAYKKWDSQKLADRLRMPLDIIEHAIHGRKDLASLKVEALLSTWEEEMQHVGWQPNETNRRK